MYVWESGHKTGGGRYEFVLKKFGIVKDCIKDSCCLVFTASMKREIMHFHVIVVHRRQRNVQKSVMHEQSCCFANLNQLLFCRSRCRRRFRCLSSLLKSFKTTAIKERQKSVLHEESCLFAN